MYVFCTYKELLAWFSNFLVQPELMGPPLRLHSTEFSARNEAKSRTKECFVYDSKKKMLQTCTEFCHIAAIWGY